MSTTTKKSSAKGVRYTDAQKKEVVDFAVEYNSSNGRGGQSKAAEKFGISPLTVASWLKGTSAPAAKAVKADKAAKAEKAPKAAKVAKEPKAPKAPKAAATKGKAGSRYTDEQKKEVTDFVVEYNAANGRGGASKASKKFSVSPLTVMAWLKASGVTGSPKKAAGTKYVAPGKKSTKATKAGKSTAPVSGGMSAKLNQLLSLSEQIADAEAELAEMKAKFDSLKASL